MLRFALPGPISPLLATMAMALVALLTVPSALVATAAGDDLPKAEVDSSATEFTLDADAPADWFERLKTQPNVTKLTVRRPALKRFKAAQLRDLPQLASFHAADFPLESRLADAVAAHLADLPRLQAVAFERTGLTSRGLQFLRDASIAELMLTEEEFITDDAFEHVAQMKSLRKLVLDATPIDVAGLKHLQHCPQLRSFALRRHPAGSSSDGAEDRLAAIAGLDQLEELELESTAYERLVVLQQIDSLKQLTLRRCGALEVSSSLKELKQLKKLIFEDCDLRNETFGDMKAALRDTGIEVVDATPQKPSDLLTRGSSPLNEATRLARRLHDELNFAKRHPAFWIRWRSFSHDVPSMHSEPVRTIYRLKKALSEDHVRRKFAQETIMAWAPQQFYIVDMTSEDGVATWEQIKYGDAKIAWARERRPGNPPRHFIRNGVSEFVDSLFSIPHQFRVSQQSYWWGAGDHHRITTSPVSPGEAVYQELPAEEFADETCRVLESAGRCERLWISQTTGRLRGSLCYIHQGYFIPFHKQNIVTQIAGRPIASPEDYRELVGAGEHALPEEKKRQLTLAWYEYSFDHAIPGRLHVFSDYREIAPGCWFPFQVQCADWLHNEQNQGRYDFYSSESIVTEVAVDRDDLEKYWAEALPQKGEAVQDQRYGTPVEYKFGDDQSDDKIQKLVNEQLFKYARSAMLISARTQPIENMIGKPAPALPTERWIGEPPDVKGKRYLIHCWATWCGPCKNDVPLLNSLSKNEIVIGVHPSGTEMDQIRKAAADEKMTYPTAVAPPGAKDMLGYPVTVFPYCIEVDEEGKVARHGSLHGLLEMRRETVSAAKAPPSVKGVVLDLDSDGGLAVISLGEADGVQKQQLFHVMQGERQAAKLQIVFAQKNRAVGKVVDEKQKVNIKEGDVVQGPLD